MKRNLAILSIVLMCLFFYIALMWVVPLAGYSAVGEQGWGCSFWIGQLELHGVIALAIFFIWGSFFLMETSKNEAK